MKPESKIKNKRKRNSDFFSKELATKKAKIKNKPMFKKLSTKSSESPKKENFGTEEKTEEIKIERKIKRRAR
jgi:hypothetical protein